MLCVFCLAFLGIYCLAIAHFVPPRQISKVSWHNPGKNWFGQGDNMPKVYSAIAVLSLIVLQIAILAWFQNRSYAVLAYATIVVMLIPFIWFFAVDDWDAEFASYQHCWIGYPILIITVPTISFFFQLAIKRSLLSVTLWGMVELTIGIPLWLIIWLNVEYLLLRWIG